MTKNSNTSVDFSGQYMVQDSDHLGAIPQTKSNAKASRGNARQSDQSQGNRQQVSGKSRSPRQAN